MKPYAQVLKKHDEHLDTLRSLKLLSPTNEIASPSKIISRLTKAIDESARKAGLQDPDLLKPAFVFMMPDQTMIWRRWGETIPKDAVSYGGVLPTAEYSQMLRDGFFPVGTSQPTITGLKFTTFEHDLAHLTSFIQYPEYMKAIRDQARLQHESRTIEVEGQHELSYLLGEGLLVVDPSLHLKLGDILQTGPFYRPLAHIDVVEKIRALTPQQLEKLLMFPINDLTHYVHVMGGAGRDPFSRNYVRHNLIEGSIKNAFFDPLMKIRYNENSKRPTIKTWPALSRFSIS